IFLNIDVLHLEVRNVGYNVVPHVNGNRYIKYIFSFLNGTMPAASYAYAWQYIIISVQQSL
ncbi:hypothetical protein KBT16_20765, partial [Nostoc sp. CCCryo 231-06]|nr:hypothetical protein [Nostoc sp. CCCryo 231-06]